jgi:hypothetical protein
MRTSVEQKFVVKDPCKKTFQAKKPFHEEPLTHNPVGMVRINFFRPV